MKREENFGSPDRWRAWARLLKDTRAHFDRSGFLEVTTDCVVPSGAFESSLDCLKVTGETLKAELHTSPEFEMKRVLAAMPVPIYQICRSFRDDPITPFHKIEFTMLEWYEPGVSYQNLIGRMTEWLEHLKGEPLPFEKFSVPELFKQKLGVDLTTATNAQLAKITGASPSETWEDLFFRAMLEKIETALNPERPTIVYDFPARVSPLTEPRGALAQRFEIYWKGIELCNGSIELQTPKALRERYPKETELRAARGKAPHPYPERLEAAMVNMPPCGGVAVGMERLLYCLSGFSVN